MRVYVKDPASGETHAVVNLEAEDAPAWVAEVAEWGFLVGGVLYTEVPAATLIHDPDEDVWFIVITPDGAL